MDPSVSFWKSLYFLNVFFSITSFQPSKTNFIRDNLVSKLNEEDSCNFSTVLKLYTDNLQAFCLVCTLITLKPSMKCLMLSYWRNFTHLVWTCISFLWWDLTYWTEHKKFLPKVSSQMPFQCLVEYHKALYWVRFYFYCLLMIFQQSF